MTINIIIMIIMMIRRRGKKIGGGVEENREPEKEEPVKEYKVGLIMMEMIMLMMSSDRIFHHGDADRNEVENCLVLANLAVSRKYASKTEVQVRQACSPHHQIVICICF